MPRGIYKRKKKTGDKTPAARKSKRREVGTGKLLTLMRAERERLTDRVVALGTAIDALESLDN